MTYSKEILTRARQRLGNILKGEEDYESCISEIK